ncbi:hypothetical protein AVEN_52096-1 [Araneus ventricosus]|uniref:STPR domain-containing protein n=1 Tax=Araneus ventricosus TaxID=182803 RepID=A0A4Y2VE63_ARAVE|nr:hypothetical protein AVEN_52096-1 [Araneus ventricosus]
MAQRGQKRRAEETEEQRNRGLSHMAQRGLERKTEETEEQRNSRLSDMAQRSQERRAKEIRRTKEWSIGHVPYLPHPSYATAHLRCWSSFPMRKSNQIGLSISKSPRFGGFSAR